MSFILASTPRERDQPSSDFPDRWLISAIICRWKADPGEGIPSPHYSRTQLANNAGLIRTPPVGGPDRIRRRRCMVTPHTS
jgi:hypothetical protein